MHMSSGGNCGCSSVNTFYVLKPGHVDQSSWHTTCGSPASFLPLAAALQTFPPAAVPLTAVVRAAPGLRSWSAADSHKRIIETAVSYAWSVFYATDAAHQRQQRDSHQHSFRGMLLEPPPRSHRHS
eukprot:27762-Eustigmatos_ZCMA.PRE.1